MNTKSVVSLIFVILFGSSIALAETQLELNAVACNELKTVENRLNQVYREVMTKYKNDKVFIYQLIKAQQKWVEFKDAYVDSMYIPQYKSSYGSVLPMCQCHFIENIINDRIKQLQVWVDGIDEGDACSGSVL